MRSQRIWRFIAISAVSATEKYEPDEEGDYEESTDMDLSRGESFSRFREHGWLDEFIGERMLPGIVQLLFPMKGEHAFWWKGGDAME